MYCFAFTSLEMEVKNPSKDAEFELINRYVHAGLERAKGMYDSQDTKAAHLRIVDTLLNVVCDSLLTIAWRKYCFRMIQRLKPLLFEILEKRQYQRKIADITTLYNYFIEHTHNTGISILKASGPQIFSFNPSRK
ncbi:MAG: hypothetical protein ABJV04_17805 [Aliiglaciecola sp.]|uniref:hypothetical protein n=1 Tax=Aliiglaciecola sp. TaxID=1872441 RepID=UPI003296B147